MSNLRLPTMQQLSKMGARDAAAILDYQESELIKAIGGLSRSSAHYVQDKRNLQAALRRVQRRHADFFKA